jgi:hypothetical protein
MDSRLEWVLEALFISSLAALLLLLLLQLLLFMLSRGKLLSSAAPLFGVCGTEDITGSAE